MLGPEAGYIWAILGGLRLHCLDCSCSGLVGGLQGWKNFRGKQVKFQEEVRLCE